jgi:hypothetical protein
MFYIYQKKSEDEFKEIAALNSIVIGNLILITKISDYDYSDGNMLNKFSQIN